MSDINLKTITFPQIGNKYLLGDPTLSISGTGADAKATGDALATKANTDGSYESMTVGNAEQLVSNVRVNDKTPYLFRTSGGSVDIGDREYVNGIVGGTVAWNQMFDSSSKYYATQTVYGLTFTNNNDGTITVDGTYTGNTSNSIDLARYSDNQLYVIQNHKYLYLAPKLPDTVIGTNKKNMLCGNTAKMGYITSNGSTIVNCRATGNTYTIPRLMLMEEGSVFSNYRFCYSIIDLTQLFGSTIADYIYSLEQANAGAGVAWFKKLFPKPYYAYNAGELMSVSGLQSHDMTGFNQWDEEWESGLINSDGTIVADSRRIVSKNYIAIVPNTSYYVAGFINGRAAYYDADKNFVAYEGSFVVDHNFTTPTNAHYMKFSPPASYGTTYNHDICINISWDGSRDGEYEPYELHSYPLDSDLTLRGIPKLDANNNLYYDGDMYEPSGEVTRKYGVYTITGNEAYNYDAWRANAIILAVVVPESEATIYTASPFAKNEKWSDVNTYRGNGMNYFYFENATSAFADIDAFKSAMVGTHIVYKLATPITETADPYNGTQIVDDFGTEEYVIDSDTFAVPVGHDTDYPIDLKAKVEMAPNSPDGDGDYIVRQTNGMNEYVPLVIEDALPTIPSTAGTYKLTVTVTEGSDPVLAWTQA